jgi:hypothetical protein
LRLCIVFLQSKLLWGIAVERQMLMVEVDLMLVSTHHETFKMNACNH